MKRILFFAALVLGVVSCQKDHNGLDVDANGEAAFTLNVALPEAVTRAAGSDSALGGVINIDMTKYDIRYILEVYNNDASNATLLGTLAKERMVNYETEATSTSFSLRLIPGRDYRFVVWADFVEQDHNNAQDHSADRLYDTSNGLKQVTLATNSWTAIDESRDAYTNYFDVDDFSSTSTVNFELTRPFAKLRVVTNDIKELYGDLMPKTAVVNYYNTKFYTSFNAFEQAVAGATTTAPKLTVDLADDTYSNEANPKADASKGEMTLFADYFFGAEDNRVMFTLDVTDNTNQAIPTVTFNTNIPVERNYLTTIYGPILTDANNVTVTINDAFANDINKAPYYQEIWDGTSASEPKKNAEGKYVIEQPSELAWLADQVNGVTRAGGKNFKGETFILNNDIDLGGALWTPIGVNSSIGEDTVFRGTFDGNGKTIANLVVRTEGKTTAGLFSNFRGVMKNLTIKNADIEGHYKVGVIAGEVVCGKVVDCHVDGARVYVTPYNNDDACHVGGIAGYLSADGSAASVENCSVNGAEIYAFRDVAGIVGTTTGKNNPTLKGNTVANTTITADQTQEYYTNDKDGNAGIFGGRQASASTIVDNTEGENVVVIRKVDSTKEFEAALKDRRNEDVIYVGEGEVVLPASLAVSGIDKLTIEGLDAKAAVQFNSQAGGADGGLNCYADGTELIFKNIKVVSPNTGSAYTGGFGRAKSVLFDNCYYEGQYRSMSYVNFNKCTIDPKTSYIYTDYSDADFVECTFNCSEGKGIQVYNDGNTTNTTINVTDCTFTAAKHGQTWDKKPVTAIDINSNGEKFTVNINNTTATGFPEGEYTGETLFNIKGGAEHVTIKIDGNTWVGKGIITDDEGNLVVNSILSLETALESAGAAGAGDTTIVFEENSTLDMTNVEWTPIKVDGYHGADIVTIDGKGSVIKGLTSALFAGGFAGGSGIIIKNLTIEDSAIVADNTQGYGAFVNNADSMDVITLENCHLKNSSIITPNDGATDSRIGGLIGWTSGYNVTSDGPVDSFITVKNCSVIGCTLKGAGSIGAICGHAGANPATYTTIENCTIQNNNLISTDDGGWRVGVVVGTANVGEVTISNITESGNTLTQTGKTAPEGEKRNYYGRFVPGTTGKLTIDGEEVVMINSAEKLTEAINNAKAGDTITIDGDITLTENVTIPAGVTINGNGKQINGTLIAGGDIAFAGHTKVTAFSAGFSGYEITIGEGACLEITGEGRSTMGYNNTFNITGTITDAESADKTNIQPSLIMPAGISISGGNGLELNIKDAYVQIGNTSSKNSAANGTFTINIENSIAEFTHQLTFSEPTSGMNPTFNLNVKNSVLTTAAKLILAAPNCNMVVDNSTIDVKTYFRNSGNVELKNGSVLTGNTIQFGENGGHDGTTTVDASKFTIKASSTGHAYDGRGTGSITLKNGAEVNVDYYKDLTINIGANSTFIGTQVW